MDYETVHPVRSLEGRLRTGVCVVCGKTRALGVVFASQLAKWPEEAVGSVEAGDGMWSRDTGSSWPITGRDPCVPEAPRG